MALLFFDGFDHTSDHIPFQWLEPSSFWMKWSIYGDPWDMESAGRTGPRGIRLISYPSYTVITRPLPAVGGFVIGVAMRVPDPYTWVDVGAPDLIQIREGVTAAGVVHMSVGCTAAGKLTVKRGTTVLATSTPVFDINRWYYIEFKGTIHDTFGSYTVRVDKVPVPGLVSTGSVDTRNGGTTGQWDRVCLAGNGNDYDDLYVCDTSGVRHNNFLGPCRVETIMPQEDAVAVGTYHEWAAANDTATPPTDHGAIVNRLDNSNYGFQWFYATATGAKDSFQLPPRNINLRRRPIIAVQTTMLCKRDDTAERHVRPFFRIDEADYVGPTILPNAVLRGMEFQVWPLNPATSQPWTNASIAAAEVGIEVVD